VDRLRRPAGEDSGKLNMYWQDDKPQEAYVSPDDVVDLAFGIVCRALPVDHAFALSRAVLGVLPWLAEEHSAGVHTIHVAESGNGWLRPDKPDAMLYLSRRTRLVLRLPRNRLAEAQALCGCTLDVAGEPMKVESAAVRRLSTNAAVFARYVVFGEGLDESGFLAQTVDALGVMGVRPKKMLCGIERVIVTPERAIRTRSLMVADLAPRDSVTLQQKGLGPLRHLGCGLFLPHKDVREVKDALD
jgi:CRISPR-associated protein Cas6